MHAVVRLSRALCELSCAHAVCTGSSVARTTPPLVRALMRVLRPILRVSNALSRGQAWLQVTTEKHPVATPPWKTLSRHKILCHDRNIPPLGKLYYDTRRPLSRPKPGPALNPAATLNFCHETGPTNHYSDREGLCRDLNHPTCLGTMSRHRDPCLDTEFLSRHRADKPISRQRRPLLPPKPPNTPGNNVATWRSLSRHKARKLCCAHTLCCR